MIAGKRQIMPYLRVVHSGGSDDVEDIADAYIWEKDPVE